MQVFIVKIEYDYEGFTIDSTYASEADAELRAETLRNNSKLPMNHPNHEIAGDNVDVECLEVIL